MFKSLANLLARLGKSLFGAPSWTPAPWMQASGAKIKAKPAHSFLLLLVLIGLGFLGRYAYQWYLDRPQPISFYASFQAPAIPGINSDDPAQLNVRFSIDRLSRAKAEARAAKYKEYQQEIPKNALRLDKMDKVLRNEVSIEPFIEGEWRSTENGLSFKPAKHWPADVTYTLRFDPGLFLENISLTKPEYSFTTAKLSVKTSNVKIHSDPNNAKEQRVIGTFEFSHPVDPKSLEQKLLVEVRNDAGERGYSDLEFTLSPDNSLKDHELRVFYLNSEAITISEETRFLKVELLKDVETTDTNDYYRRPDSAPAKLVKGDKKELTIPSVKDFFRIRRSHVRIVRDPDENPQQALIIELTDSATPEIIADHLEVFLLPPKDPEREWKRWSSASEVAPNILEQAERLSVTTLPLANESSQVFSFVFDALENRQLFIRLKKGAKSTGNFVTSKDFRAVHQVPNYPKEVSIMGVGSVLDRSGAHQVGFVSRGVEQLRVSVSQVRTDQINHLISQTNGNFKNPDFNYNFSAEDLSIVHEEVIALQSKAGGKASYASVDLSAKLNQGDLKSGLFHIEVAGEDRDGRSHTRTQRIILVTDIGFITKVNADQSQDVFVQSIQAGRPMNAARISVLGKNGLPVFNTVTDERGHARLPDLSDLKREKRPIAIVVERVGDLAYLPTNNHSRQLNASRFETGGVYWDSRSEQNLRAFLFTDRGIYRPGEKVHMGLVVREFDLGASASFPVQLSITDPRGVTVYEQKHRLPKDGFFEAELQTANYSATGIYQANLRLIEQKNAKRFNYKHLGSMQFSVEEFQPDRLKIKSGLDNSILQARPDAKISDGSVAGWLNPGELNFNIDLQNLFGTPAQDRKVTAKYRMHQSEFRFSQHPDYRFSHPFDYKRNIRGLYQSALKDTRTDKNGKASFDIDLRKFVGGNYQLMFDVNGYEANGGRSVQTRNSIRFSPRDYLIGYKVDGNLNYLKRAQEQSVNFVCVDRFIQAQDCNALSLRVIEKKYISTLIKQPNGTYQYQSIEKQDVLSNTDFTLPRSGYRHTLDTQKPGKYLLQMLDANGEVRQAIHYQIVGAANLNADLEKDSQLDVVLDKAEYAAGDWIELQLKAPYTGSGLISIETTNTHHFAWFKTDSTQSMQRIQVPTGLQGNAYVQVAFVRAPDSKEIFSAPLSYAIAPFKLSRAKYALNLELNVAEKVRPGEALSINYRSDQKARIAIFAVDEGVLQVAKYKTPKPLDHFLEKRALQVNTYQMFDLLLPEFELMRELSAAGGGVFSRDEMLSEGKAKNLNPFARKVKDPVAYWSGIIEAGPRQQQVTYQVPDHFDGSLRVMAVAISEAQFAHAQENVTVRGPFIVSPNVPTVVAPGDTFNVVVGVSNQLEGSGADANVNVEAVVSEHLSLVGTAQQDIAIPEGDEKSIRFTLKANQQLGSADIRFVAKGSSINESSAQRSASSTLSVRPATLKTSRINSGRSKKGETLVSLSRTLMPDMASSQVFASPDPALLVNGLISYLSVYPHACTEQVVSQLSPLLAFVDHPNYLGTPKDKQQKLQSLFQSLQQRQLSNGGFTLWPGGHSAAPIPTVHSLHTMLDAQERDVTVPTYVIDSGLQYLGSIAYDVQKMRSQPELVAYALYLLTRSGELTNNALVQLESILTETSAASNKNNKEAWKEQLTAAYMAASYQLLKRQKDATQLIRKYRFKNARSRINRYDSALYRDAMAMYLMARHFPDEFNQEDTSRIEAIVEPILVGNLNTLSSGRALLALRAYSDLINAKGTKVKVSLSANQQQDAKAADDGWRKVALKTASGESVYPFANLAFDDQTLRFESRASNYYQTTQVGFDKFPPLESESNGLEISKTFTHSNGKTLDTPPLQGEDVTVNIRIRSTDNQRHADIVVIDLLPGGFEIDRDSVRRSQSWNPEYIDIREDRLVYYGAVGPRAVNISYKARLTTSGTFVAPAVYANAMYDESLNAHSAATQIQVLENK